jgi:uncharacterized protein YqjF (DUF2071 family)
MPQRPLLTAEWRNLVLLNFPVPTNIIEDLAPPGTEPDLHDGQSFISIVGFRFDNVRLFGLRIPGHANFPEINLRFYVRRTVAGDLRRGVVFAREIVPRRAVSIVANHLYNESYITRPMRSEIQIAGNSLAPGDKIEYAWRTKILVPFREGLGKGSSKRANIQNWNHLTAQVAAPLALPAPGSLEEFIVEHYWGYTRGHNGQTREYQVAHDPWRVAAADSIAWECDIATTYDRPLAEYLTAPPTSAIIADGSPIQVFRGRPCGHN